VKLVKLSPVCGVEVQGVDLRQDLSTPEIAEIRQAFLRAHLLLFRRQADDDEAHARFLSHLGKLEPGPDGPFRSVVDYVSTERADNVARAGRLLYHIDRSFQMSPPYAVSFFAVKMSPGAGPGTTFVNAEAAYRGLPDPLKARLRGLSIVNVLDLETSYVEETKRARKLDVKEEDQVRYPHATHPAVVNLPISEAPTLLVNEHTTSHFVGMDPNESEELYLQVLECLYRPDNTFCHDWQLGDFVVWNNLALHHGRRAAPVGTRELRRMIVLTAA
jgi:taurine dioxygenase